MTGTDRDTLLQLKHLSVLQIIAYYISQQPVHESASYVVIFVSRVKNMYCIIA